MKRGALLIVIFNLAMAGYGQYSEFTTHSNGLIYSDSTMKQLEFIVDSLNIKFRTCELDKTYLSKYQVMGHHVYLNAGEVGQAKNDLENNISFSEFIRKYPDAKVDSDLLIVRFQYKNYHDEDMVEFQSYLSEHSIEIEDHPGLADDNVKDSWVFSYWPADEYSKETINAFYFTTDRLNRALPETYARMLQYSDCMVDTSTQIFTSKAERTGVYYKHQNLPKCRKFMKYVHKKTDHPGRVKRKGEGSWEQYHTWDSLRIELIDSLLSHEQRFNKLLKSATEEALAKGGSSGEFEEYVGLFYSPEAALELKRGRIVVGGCSQDRSPRIHAMNIAILSAETVNWEIFLRAHLDIMNDRFERVTDGSYAWAGRKTYIKELEELDINVPDLILGICLRIENPSQNHYYGSIGRLGRALSETMFAAEVENKILDMIKDDQLDDFNRIIMYFLFRNYLFHIEDEEKVKQNLELLSDAVQSLPEYMVQRINLEE